MPTAYELRPLILFISLFAVFVVSMWRLARPVARKGKTCPQCGSLRTRRAGWGPIYRPKYAWSGLLHLVRRLNWPRRRWGIVVNQQHISYRCKTCQHKWQEKVILPTLGEY